MISFAMKIKGRVAEWLGRGLQNLVQRFESARDLQICGLFSHHFIDSKKASHDF